jgi:hypothetical protein
MFTVQPLSQTDPHWKDKLLGTDISSTIGKYGCLLTCMTMVANGFGFQETPDTLNEKMKSVGGFQGAMVIPGALPAALPGMRYKKYQPCENYPAPMDEINATLVTGQPVIVMVDYSPAVGVQNHWIVLVDRKDGDYVIQDPYPYPAETKEVLLTKRYGFAGSPQNIIQAALWLESDVEQPPQPKPTPKPIPTSGFVVYASVDALAIRTKPVVADDTLIKRVRIHTKCYVIEDPTLAKKKIGQQGEWLNVIEADEGYEGYVAAWYVSTEATPQPPAPQPPLPEPPTPVPPTPPPADQTPAKVLIVYAMTEGLAFRSQPVVASNTLIKQVPVNSQFRSLEPVGKASSKLGVINQWLNVEDVEGDSGYVAAWFVSQYRQDALGVTDKPTTITPPGSALKKLVVRAAEENLALRKQPLISDATLIKRYPIISEFLVLEPIDQAQAKIGVMNQWLHVRSLDGNEGYLAAWYVVLRPAVRI